MKKQERTTWLVIAILVLNTIGGLVLALFMYNFISDPSSAFNRSLAQRIQTVVGQFKPLDGVKGDTGRDGQSIVGPQGPQGPEGKSIAGPEGPPGRDGLSIKGDTGATGETGSTGPAGAPAPLPTFRCDAISEQIQYKYPLDEDWTDIGAKCEPIGEEYAVRR